MDILDPADPENPHARVTASRLRKRVARGTVLEPSHVEWLAKYEAAQRRPSKGRSAHRKESYTVEESAAEGEGGDAVAIAAAQASAIREEGRREDSLADRGIAALERAFARQEKLVEFMMARMDMLERAHLEDWHTTRDARLRYTEAEIALMQKEAEEEGKEDQLGAMAAELLPHLLKQLKAGGGK